MIKAVIFDCFGVIRPDNLLLTYQRLGGDIEADRRFIEDTIAAANRGMITNSRDVLAKRLGVTADDWLATLDDDTVNDQALLDYIASLRKDFKTAILSNVGAGRLAGVVGELELRRCFDVVAESGTLRVAKPQAESYQTVADRLGVSCREALFTDDNEEYCQAAQAVGMQAIVYHSFEQFKHDFEAIVKT